MEMAIHILPQRIKYDGSQIAPLWAYEQGIAGNSIVVFRGPMDVSLLNMKDLADKKAHKAIKGDDLIHFIVERFDSPASIRLAYYMQRLLVICIQEMLTERGVKTDRSGDDLFAGNKKLTVSIASAGVSSEKIHCGVNLTSGGTPDDVETVGLFELDITDWESLALSAANRFVREITDIEGDIVKTRCL